ncbi:hypothetical protein [Paludisphaera sp.]|uniref:hypothetical protein n=1 Tax=Paludisphaera sp. TaxID=2017432 RepID=UPI00301BB453
MDGRPDAGRGFAWYVKPFLAVGCILVFLTTPIWLPLVPLIARLQAAGERRFLQRMKARGRFKTWEELRPALEAGEGTLIIEQGYKLPVRVWWTADDLLSSAPCPPPSDDEIQALVVVPRPHEFVAWCHRRYTAEEAGTAMLTLPADMPDGYILAPDFRERFPGLTTIDTVHDLARRERAD